MRLARQGPYQTMYDGLSRESRVLNATVRPGSVRVQFNGTGAGTSVEWTDPQAMAEAVAFLKTALAEMESMTTAADVARHMGGKQ